MKQKPGIALPRWLLRTTTMQMHSVDVVAPGISEVVLPTWATLEIWLEAR
ncbi:hypothetical protein [Pseudomonas aeruginosa]